MGDLTSEKEEEILRKTIDVSADILKVGHHGSKYSTSEKFLEKVSPRNAVISAGRNNSYGHPALEILERMKKSGVEIFRTDEIGDISYGCDDQRNDCQLSVR